jgi:hypothetical protein
MRASERQFGADVKGHDVACRYLCARAADLVDRILPAPLFGRWSVVHAGLERDVPNGQSVSFIDVVVQYRMAFDLPPPDPAIIKQLAEIYVAERVQAGVDQPLPPPRPLPPRPLDELIVEVKVQPEPLGNVLRQEFLSRRLLRQRDWVVFDDGIWPRPQRTFVLAHCYPLERDERRHLVKHDIRPLRLPEVTEMKRFLRVTADGTASK